MATSPLEKEVVTKLKNGAQEKGFKSQGEYLSYIIGCYLANEYNLDHYDDLFTAQVDQSFAQIYEQMRLLKEETKRLADNSDWLDQLFIDL